MLQKNGKWLVSIFFYLVILGLAGGACAIDCEDCSYITSVDIKDAEGNDVFDATDTQIVTFDASGPPIKVKVQYEITDDLVPCKVICCVKGPGGETFEKKKRIQEAGVYKYTAKYLFLSPDEALATVKCKLKVRKRGIGLVGKDVMEVDMAIGDLY
jgi:hypothetical protein